MDTPALELCNISCTFRPRTPAEPAYTAVADTSLLVQPGEFVSLVGPTGCGKSTLLNVAAGLLTPSLGEVRVFGQVLQGINAFALGMRSVRADAQVRVIWLQAWFVANVFVCPNGLLDFWASFGNK